MKRIATLSATAALAITACRPAAPDLCETCLEILRAGLAAHETQFWPAMHAAEALTQAGRSNETRAILEPLLAGETDAQKRCGIARELARAGDDSMPAVLIGILQDSDEHGHVHAAESLFKLGWCADPALLREALAREPNPRLRIMAAAALARGGHEEGLRFLREGIAREPQPELLFLFAWALGQTGSGGEDAARIRARLGDAPDAWTRSFLEHALARLGDTQGLTALLRNLDSSDARIQTHAAETAGALRLAEAQTWLAALLNHADLDTRVRAAQALLHLN